MDRRDKDNGSFPICRPGTTNDTLINKFSRRTENSWLSKFQQAWSDSISTGGFVSLILDISKFLAQDNDFPAF